MGRKSTWYPADVVKSASAGKALLYAAAPYRSLHDDCALQCAVANITLLSCLAFVECRAVLGAFPVGSTSACLMSLKQEYLTEWGWSSIDVR